MDRYLHIQSLKFGLESLPLPLLVRLSRSVQAAPAGGDNDAFITSVQLDQTTVSAEIRIRGTAVAESLSLGQQGDLTFAVAPTCSGQSARSVTLAGAVLVGVDIGYEQGSMAVATLRFIAEAADGNTDPFSAEDS